MISTNLSIPHAILRFIAIIIALMIIGTSWQSPYNIMLYTLMISCPHPHRHPDDQHNLMGPGNRNDHQTLHCASFYPSTMIINSSPHPLIILSSSPLEGPAIVLPVKQLWHILHVPVSAWFCAIFCSNFFSVFLPTMLISSSPHHLSDDQHHLKVLQSP